MQSKWAKAIRLILLWSALGYMAYDQVRKEEYVFAGFMGVGIAVFTYVILIAKKKE